MNKCGRGRPHDSRRDAGGTTEAASVHADAFGLAEGLLQVLACFVDRSLGVVIRLDGETVLADGAVALAGDVKDFADGDMAPNLGPGRRVVAAQGVAEGVDAGLVVALGKEHFANAIAGQGAEGVGLERLFIFVDGAEQVVLGHQLLAFQDGNADLKVGAGSSGPSHWDRC